MPTAKQVMEWCRNVKFNITLNYLTGIPIISEMYSLYMSDEKHGFLGLTPVSSDTTALRKSYLKLGLQIVR